MSESNSHIPTLLNVLALLETVPGTELERKTLTSKLHAFYHQGRERLTGKALVDELNDDELVAAIATRDPQLNLFCGPGIEPFLFNHIRHNRPGIIERADAIRIQGQ